MIFDGLSPESRLIIFGMKSSIELENQAAAHIAGLMAAAARTAPKTRGMDNIVVLSIDDKESKERIMQKMREVAARENRGFMERDAKSIAASPVLLVIGVASNPAGLDCGYCGFPTCEAMKNAGAVCSFNSFDLGIAVASAADIAGRFHIDNRLMFSIGRACLDLGFFENKVKQALGIPLSITGKNPFFDRQ